MKHSSHFGDFQYPVTFIIDNFKAVLIKPLLAADNLSKIYIQEL